MQRIKAGDVVQLKSGGAMMTVEDEYYSQGHNCNVVWFDENGELCRSQIKVDCLKIVGLEDKSDEEEEAGDDLEI